jgi:predicted HTH transcriptional regulator
VEEYHRLEAAAQALEGVGTAKPARRSRSTTTRTGGGTGRRGRPRGSGTRGKEALELVRANPGITIPELADRMGIKQNYLYRVLPGLQKDGMVRKEGRGWHARDAA